MPPVRNLAPQSVKRKPHGSAGRASRLSAALAALALTCATAWDSARLMGSDTAPRVSSILLAAGIALGCVAVLLRVLGRTGARVRNAVELIVLGLALLAWVLRGHPDIPADPPLVAVELLAALVLGAGALVRRRRPVG